MESITFVEEYVTQDKSEWPRGPWDNEPDKVVWVDEATNLDCMIKRNHLGALCGYVGVSDGHPVFARGYYDDMVDIDASVHGGLTFANFCDDDEDQCHEDRICHIAQLGRPKKVWWLGFDCAHAGDFTPAYSDWGFGNHDSYRDIGYVIAQCQHLAQQLATDEIAL